MLAFGALSGSFALLALAAFIQIFRRPGPPTWAGSYGVGEMVAVGVVASFALGLACLGAGAMSVYQTGITLLDLGLLAAVLGAALVAWRRLRVGPAATGTAAPVPRGAHGAGAVVAIDAVPLTTPEPPSSAPNRRSARRVA